MANELGASVALSSSTGRPSRWEAPYQSDGSQSSKDRLLAWIREAINEGEQFLESQSGYRFVNASRRIMADIGFDELPRTLSKASMNFVKRDVRELVGTLANPRPLASFKCDNPDFDLQADILNKGYLHWYNASFADRALRSALQFAAVEGTGYLCMEWDPGYWGAGRGEIALQALGVDAVLPIQISPEDWNLQGAYAVIIRRQYPITHVMRRFPLSADRLVPDGENASKWRRLVNKMVDRVTPTVHNTYGTQRGYRGDDPLGRYPVTVYDIYLLDPQVNQGRAPLKKGVPGSPWEYNVPFYGEPLPTGVADPLTGKPLTRAADMHDARLFPYRRHIVATRNLILYDDTSRWWHGQVPLIKFRLDDWPFEYCGIPVTKEPAKLQAMVASLLRAYDDSSNARLRPPLSYDGQRVSDALARSFDPRAGGQVIEMSNLLGEAFKLLVDPRYYQMQQDILPLIQYAKEEGTKLMGLHDLVAMQKAAQLPSADTLEKMAEMAGPIATDMSRNMEASLRDQGEMFKALFFEFYTARRRFQLFGPDGLTPEDFDYDPGQLTPANLDLPGLGYGGTRAERARAHMQNFHFSIVPNSVYQMTQSTRRLLLLQLARMGMPISPYTLMEQFDIPNPGRPPMGALTEIEKWKAWKREELDVMIESQMKLAEAQMAMQQQAQQAAQQADPLGQLSQAIQAAVQAPTAQGTQSSNPQGQGRPPSGQKPPHVETKDQGLRTTIAES